MIVRVGAFRHSPTSTVVGSLAVVISALLLSSLACAETVYQRDNQGRITGWSETQGRSAQFELTADGKIARVRASGGLEASHAFDAAGRVSSIRHPGGASTRLGYDANANISWAVDRLGRHHRFTHNASRHVLRHIDRPAGSFGLLEIRVGTSWTRVTRSHCAAFACPWNWQYWHPRLR